MLRHLILLMLSVLSVLIVVACATGPLNISGEDPLDPLDPLEKILSRAENSKQGSLEIKSATYLISKNNIEEERWSSRLSIQNHAPVSGHCNILLQVFNKEGNMLDEYLVFNDTLNYESMVTHNDIISIKRTHLELIHSARYSYNCLKKDLLGR